VQNNCKSFAQAGKLFAAFSISKMSISNENENKKQLPKHLAKLSLTGKCHYTQAVGKGWRNGGQWILGTLGSGNWLSGHRGLWRQAEPFSKFDFIRAKMANAQRPAAARKIVQGSGVAST